MATAVSYINTVTQGDEDNASWVLRVKAGENSSGCIILQ